MPLLFDADYSSLKDRCISYEEAESHRFFIFTRYELRQGLYKVPDCDVLVVIPQNYNQAGNDMLWTFPRLHRTDGKQIPQTLDPGGGDNRICNGKEFCRWSRHWNASGQGVWRPGKDGIISIYRRIDWALRNPDCQ
jgi:hypothetical protein